MVNSYDIFSLKWEERLCWKLVKSPRDAILDLKKYNRNSGMFCSQFFSLTIVFCNRKIEKTNNSFVNT